MVTACRSILVVLDVAETLHRPEEVDLVRLAGGRIYARWQRVRSIRRRVEAARLLEVSAQRSHVKRRREPWRSPSPAGCRSSCCKWSAGEHRARFQAYCRWAS